MEIGFNPVYTVDSQSMWAFSQDDQTNPNWRYSVVPNWQKYKAGEFPGANRQTRYYAISVTVPPLSQGYPLFEFGVYSREGVIMYVNFIFIAIFLGYSMGCAPIVGYHYGAGNRAELRKSLCI